MPRPACVFLPMNGLLEEILSAEAEGRRLAAAARARAAELLAEAGRRARALAEAELERGRREAEKTAADILQAAALEKAARLAAARAEIESAVRLDGPELGRLADEVVRRVLET